jgi:hypothetical protein
MTDALIGSRVRIDYDDQNESFATHLPAYGTVIERCTATTGADDWYLVELEEPLDYQHQTGPHFQFERLIVSRVLVRSRWRGEPLGPTTSPSVFLLLVSDGRAVDPACLKIADFIFICWARCRVLDAS